MWARFVNSKADSKNQLQFSQAQKQTTMSGLNKLNQSQAIKVPKKAAPKKVESEEEELAEIEKDEAENHADFINDEEELSDIPEVDGSDSDDEDFVPEEEEESQDEEEDEDAKLPKNVIKKVVYYYKKD